MLKMLNIDSSRWLNQNYEIIQIEIDILNSLA